MLIEALAGLALVAAPQPAFEAGVTTAAQGGLTPVQPGQESLAAVSLEVTPTLTIMVSDTSYDLAIGYTPRIFYRGFLEDSGQFGTVNRPLFLHTANISYSRLISRRWRLTLSSTGQLGEVDFQAAPGVVGAAINPNADIDTPVNPGDPSNDQGGPLANVSTALVLRTITIFGAINIDGQMSARLTWSNMFSANYISPLGDATVGIGSETLPEVGTLPESYALGYSGGIAYSFNREHSINGTASYLFNSFEATTIDGSATNDQTFHSFNLALGYGYDFGRSSRFAINAGAQVVIGNARLNAADVGNSDLTDDQFVLPTAQLELTWVPIQRRSFNVSNNVAVGVLGSPDPSQGGFQPRLTGVLGFTIGLPGEDTTVALLGSIMTPIQEPQDGAGFILSELGIGDSQVEVSIPVTVQVTRHLITTFGARAAYMWTRFQPTTLNFTQALDESVIAEAFVSMSLNYNTRRPTGR